VIRGFKRLNVLMADKTADIHVPDN
jgi:hypothetical protein